MENLLGKKVSFRLSYNEWYTGEVLSDNGKQLSVKIIDGYSPNPQLEKHVNSLIGENINISRVLVEEE